MSWVGLESCERARARPSATDTSETPMPWLGGEVVLLANDVVDSCGESRDMAEMDDVRGREDMDRRECETAM